MGKVYIIKGHKGIWDSYEEDIIKVFKNKDDAEAYKDENEKNYLQLKNTYSPEQTEKLEFEIDEWLYYHPSSSFNLMPIEYKTFMNWEVKMRDIFNNFEIEEHELL